MPSDVNDYEIAATREKIPRYRSPPLPQLASLERSSCINTATSYLIFEPRSKRVRKAEAREHCFDESGVIWLSCPACLQLAPIRVHAHESDPIRPMRTATETKQCCSRQARTEKYTAGRR